MTDLTPADVAAFRELHRRETGVTLTDEQAHTAALDLLRLVDAVLRLSSSR